MIEEVPTTKGVAWIKQPKAGGSHGGINKVTILPNVLSFRSGLKVHSIEKPFNHQV